MSGIDIIRPGQGGYLTTECPPLGEPGAANGLMVLSHLTRNLGQAGDYGYMAGRV